MQYTFQDCDQHLEALQQWLKKQPHLPQKISEQLLRRFLLCSDLSLERSKQLIELNYTLRSQAPDLFSQRDPSSLQIRNAFNAVDYCPLPLQTEKRQRLFIYRLADTDPDKFNFTDVVKAFFMVADLRLSTDATESSGEIPMFDMAGLSLRHLTKMTLPIIKKYMVFTQEAHPVRLKQIHVLNASSFLDKCLALVRPFMKSEVARLLHFHTPNSRTLFDYVAPELIPVEYGGTLPHTMSEIKAEWMDRVMNAGSFFMDPERWTLDEARRPESSHGVEKNLFGMQGSFKALTID